MANSDNFNSKNSEFKRPMFKQEKNPQYVQIPDNYAIFYIVITTLIMAYSSFFGIYPILIFYLIWFRFIKYNNKLTLSVTKDVYGIVLLAGIAVLSTLWSDDRMGSLKGSLEFTSMLACTIIIARVVSINALVKGLIIGTFLVLLVTFKSGSYSIDGLFGSKNQVGSYAEVGASLIVFLYLVGEKSFIKSIFPSFCFIFFLICLYLSHSATSISALIATILVCLMAVFVGKMPLKVRRAVFLITFVLCFSSILLCYYFGLIDTGLNMLGKDKTLTGRTYLWSEGIKYGLDRIWTGYGYNAFWILGRPEAEKLWYEFDMFNRSGFHFHNLYVNVFVELGIFGFLIVAALYVRTIILSTKYLLKFGIKLETIYFIGMAITFLIRSISEVDTTGPFGIGPLIFYSIIPRIALLSKSNYNSEIKGYQILISPNNGISKTGDQ